MFLSLWTKISLSRIEERITTPSYGHIRSSHAENIRFMTYQLQCSSWILTYHAKTCGGTTFQAFDVSTQPSNDVRPKNGPNPRKYIEKQENSFRVSSLFILLVTNFSLGSLQPSNNNNHEVRLRLCCPCWLCLCLLRLLVSVHLLVDQFSA